MTEQYPRELSEHESAIVRMAIGTMSVGREEALAQLATAKHGGPAHAGTHPCFFIDLPNEVTAIPVGSQYPLTLWVAPDKHTVGSIELFVENGRLHSLDWSEVSLTDDAPAVSDFPSLDRISAQKWPDEFDLRA